MRNYQQNPNNRVALVRDKLYINGKLYIPTSDSTISNSVPNSQREMRPDTSSNERRYTQSARGVRLNPRPPIETQNTFECLSELTDSEERQNTMKYGKRAASSPAHDENATKQYRGPAVESISELTLDNRQRHTSEMIIDFWQKNDETCETPVTRQLNGVYTSCEKPVTSDTSCSDSSKQTVAVDVHRAATGSCITDQTYSGDIITEEKNECSQ